MVTDLLITALLDDGLPSVSSCYVCVLLSTFVLVKSIILFVSAVVVCCT